MRSSEAEHSIDLPTAAGLALPFMTGGPISHSPSPKRLAALVMGVGCEERERKHRPQALPNMSLIRVERAPWN
jgi:hypothetical protein